jgi:hypothetical protein
MKVVTLRWVDVGSQSGTGMLPRAFSKTVSVRGEVKTQESCVRRCAKLWVP